MNKPNEKSDQIQVKDYPTNVKVIEFLIGFLGFGLLDLGLIYFSNVFYPGSLFSIFSWFLALIISLIGLFSFQKKHIYIGRGILFIFILYACLPLLFFGWCIVSPIFSY